MTPMIVFDFLVCLLEFFVFYPFFAHFLHAKKLKRGQFYTIIVAASLSLTLVNQFRISGLNSIALLLITFGMAVSLFENALPITLFFAFAAVGILVLSEVVTAALISSFYNKPLSTLPTSPVFRLVITLISKLVLFIALQVIIHLFPKQRFSYMTSETFPLLFLPLISTYTALVLIYFEQAVSISSQIALPLIAVACFGLLLTNIMVFHIYDSNMKKQELAQELALAEQSAQAQAVYYRQLDQSLSDMQSARHDFKKHLIAIELLGSENPLVTNYIGELYEQMKPEQSVWMYQLGNQVFSGILQQYDSLCRQEEIEFIVSIKHHDLSFLRHSDTCVLFSNAFDNALEACRGITDPEQKRFIRLSVYAFHQMLFIDLENTFANPILPVPFGLMSTKPSPLEHGMGFQNIRKIALRYHGTADYEVKDQLFLLSIRLSFPVDCE